MREGSFIDSLSISASIAPFLSREFDARGHDDIFSESDSIPKLEKAFGPQEEEMRGTIDVQPFVIGLQFEFRPKAILSSDRENR
jgi:hypothetical protein